MNTRRHKTRQPNRFLAIVLSLCMTLTMLPVGAMTALAAGSGTENDPYQITTQEELEAITGSNHYILMNDIALEGNWEPLGSFSGTLDGNNKTITGLNVTTSSSGAGMFEEIAAGGVVKNLTLYGTVNSTFDGNAGRIGGFAAINDGTITGCTFYGSVTQMQGDNQAVGGITGLNGSDKGDATIENCKNYGDISGVSTGGTYDAITVNSTFDGNAGRIGGFAAINDGTITGCTFYGSVTQMQGDNQAVGGITGLNGSDKGDATIENCKNYGDISGVSTGGTYDAIYVGGIAGSNHGSITDCFNEGNVYAAAANANVYKGEVWGSLTWETNGAYVGGIAGDTSMKDDGSNTSTGNVVGENSEDFPNLTSIEQPSAVSVPSNTSKEELEGYLPSSVVLNTEKGTSVGNVTWNTEAYNPDREEDTYTFTGTVTLPVNVTNTDNISLTTTITVTVSRDEQPTGHSHSICGDANCGDNHENADYTALDSVSGTLAAGSYYLTADITNVDQSILITGTVNLCLNGHEISGNAEDGIFRIGENGVLNVCDCAGNGKITERGGHNPIFIHSSGTLNLYSGTMESTRTAIVIDEDPDGSVNLMGGTANIYGGTVSSTGSSYQAIKVNPYMTATTVNIYGGLVTSSNRGISAESGEINIFDGKITAADYALNLDDSAVRAYLSDSPVISGSTADINIYAVNSADDAVLSLRAKDSTSNVYTGDDLSIDLISPQTDYYVAQGVTNAEMLTKLSLVDDDYYLVYDETYGAIQIAEYTYTVTLPSGQTGYTVSAANGSTSPVKRGESFSFTVTIADGYYKTAGFEVKANNATLTPNTSGVYTITNITANQTVTVTGVAEAITVSDTPQLSGTLGDNDWYISDVTIIPPSGYQISETFNGAYGGSIILTESVGEDYTVYLRRSSDGALTNGIVMGAIKIDKDEPTITVIGNTTDYLTGDTVTITALDSTSGVAKVEVKKDNCEFVDITTSYQNGYSVTENGTYTFRVTDFAGWTAEKELVYDNIDSVKPVVTIEATHGGEVYTSGSWTNQDVTLTPKTKTSNPGITTYQYRVENGAWQDYTSEIVIDADTDADGTVYQFKAKSASGIESDTVSITVKRDTVEPDGDIKIEENSIRQLLNAIIFGLFFNENVDVTITGTDGLSGVASIQYYRSADILTEEQVAAITDEEWTEYAGPIHEAAKDAEKFVYYVKVTDNAGNNICFASNGATFDLTPPSVTGATSGFTYYTTQKVTVGDANLDTVTLNNEPVTLEDGALTLPGNTEAIYAVTATDKVGNSTTVTVTMKTIASLADHIDQMTEENVTSADKETVTEVKTDASAADTENATDEEKAALQDILDKCEDLLEKMDEVKQEILDVTDSVGNFDPDTVKSTDKETIEELVDRIDALLDGNNLTEEERETLESVKNQAETLLEKIDEAAEAGTTEDIQNVQDIKPDNVKPEDKENLEAAEEDIEQALTDYADNYTDEEIAQLEETLKQVEESLEVIQKVEKAEEAIGALPDSVNPNDTEAVEQISAAKERYDALSEYEKSLVSDAAVDKLNTLLVQLTAYYIVEGNGSVWTKGSSEGLTFVANGPYEKFAGVQMDGNAVSPENFTASSGSTVITLKPDYLNTLKVGPHTIALLYTDGEAVGVFTIAEKLDGDTGAPETGDDAHIVPWIMLMLISGGTVLILGVRRKRKKA